MLSVKGVVNFHSVTGLFQDLGQILDTTNTLLRHQCGKHFLSPELAGQSPKAEKWCRLLLDSGAIRNPKR